ncbi:hypothetical protein [Tissierella praeacuta]|uniref:hypothetical protein n=1 Tax=Tissierella praeacuta TaxID=43131 RepID=UPI00333ED3AA
MSGPLLFFILIVANIVLKSVNDKNKIEKKQTKVSKPISDLKKILVEEIEKERQRELKRTQRVPAGKKNSLPEKRIQKKTINNERNAKRDISWEIVRKEDNVKEVENIKETEKIGSSVQIKNESQKRDLRKDVLRGIIFSEILSEPKSLQNQKRSL